MNNFDMKSLMETLSKMDKKQLEDGLTKASAFLSPTQKNALMNEINKMNQNK